MGTQIVGKTLSASTRAMLALAFAASPAFLLSGCGTSAVPFGKPPTTASKSGAQGTVTGGQQPITDATIQLYTTGSGGYGSAASTFGSSAQTDSSGDFSLSPPACPGNNPDVFLVATGGMPTGYTTNANLIMMTGLGPCSGLASISRVQVNELTTIATVWALSGFMTGPTNIGAPTTNTTGLNNAFAAINEVVNIQTGALSGPSLPSGATLPTDEIDALGNILQNCVNSTGGSASDTTDGHTNGTTCGKLFYLANPSGTAPTDTVTAMLNIAQHPSLNLAYLNDLQSSTPAFSPALNVNSPPTDWTIAINYTGGGLKNPQSIAVDGSGNVWVTNPSGDSVTELSSTGAVLSGSSGYTTGGSLSAPYGIAIDQNGDAWVTSSGNNTLFEIAPAGASYHSFTLNGLDTPKGIAVDGADNIWVVNNGSSTLSGFTNAGAALTNSPYSGGGLSTPTSIAVNSK